MKVPVLQELYKRSLERGSITIACDYFPAIFEDVDRAAEQCVQRTAYGRGVRVWLANKIIGLGWWLAEIGSR